MFWLLYIIFLIFQMRKLKETKLNNCPSSHGHLTSNLVQLNMGPCDANQLILPDPTHYGVFIMKAKEWSFFHSRFFSFFILTVGDFERKQNWEVGKLLFSYFLSRDLFLPHFSASSFFTRHLGPTRGLWWLPGTIMALSLSNTI